MWFVMVDGCCMVVGSPTLFGLGCGHDEIICRNEESIRVVIFVYEGFIMLSVIKVARDKHNG